MLCAETRCGYVRIFASCCGTHTSSIPRLGSGEITVRPEKSTRLPERLPRKRPVFPFSRCANARIDRFCACHSARTEGTLGPLMYSAHCSCKNSQSSITLCTNALPPPIALRMMLFVVMMSVSFTVRSSSFEPIALSVITDGRIGTGGTSSSSISKFSGRP